MKVSELEGAQLADWVARANGWALMDGDSEQGIWHDDTGPHVLRRQWRPQEDWAQGGPIIESVGINLLEMGEKVWAASLDSSTEYWGLSYNKQFADTPLIAAMRAYVASKFGDTVTDEAPPCSA